PDEEPASGGCLQREPTASTVDHVDGQMGVAPQFVLDTRHPHRYLFGGADIQVTEVDVGVTDAELTCRTAHRGAAVAATSGLVEHQRSVLLTQLPEQGRRFVGDGDPLHLATGV